MKRIAVAVAVAFSLPAGAARADNLARNMAASCATCHGTNGKSVGGMAVLAGYQPDLLMQAFKDFKTGTRPATLMHQIAKGYDEAQVRALAAYFATQK